MAERDLRTAFHHLQEDVMNNVQTEQRLEQIIGRRTRVRPGLVAFAGAAAVVLIVGAALLALRPGNPAETVPPATGSTLPQTTIVETTVPPTTSGLVETTTTIPAVSIPELESGMVLVADPAASELASEIDSGTVVVAADRVVSDGQGGLLTEDGETVSWLRPDLPAVVLFDAADFGGEELRLEDSTIVDGATNAVFIVAGGVEEQRYEEVWRYDLSTATPTMLFHTGAYEGGIRRASLQNDILAVTRHAEGFSWFEFTDAVGQAIAVNNPWPEDAFADFPKSVDQGVLSADGRKLIYVASDSPAPPEDGNWRVDLVVWDLSSGVEVGRTEVELGNWYVEKMDYDGTGVVLGRIQWQGEGWVTGPALRIGSLAVGDAAEIGRVGIPSFVK